MGLNNIPRHFEIHALDGLSSPCGIATCKASIAVISEILCVLRMCGSSQVDQLREIMEALESALRGEKAEGINDA